MKVILIRHGMTPGNEKRQYIGRTDQGLSEKGRLEAERRLKDFSVKIVFTSDRRRTVETAKILFPNSEIKRFENLNEMDFGDFEEHNYLDLEKNEVYRAWVEGGCLGRCPNGEMLQEFEQRVWKGFRHIIESYQCFDICYFVVHGGTIQAILNRLSCGKRGFFSYHAEHLAGYEAEIEWTEKQEAKMIWVKEFEVAPSDL